MISVQSCGCVAYWQSRTLGNDFRNRSPPSIVARKGCLFHSVLEDLCHDKIAPVPSCRIYHGPSFRFRRLPTLAHDFICQPAGAIVIVGKSFLDIDGVTHFERNSASGLGGEDAGVL